MRIQTLMIALAVSLLLPLAHAAAQTTGSTTTVTTTTTPPPETGAFDKLSPGNQSIAKAIFAAQVQPTTTTGTGTGTGTTTGTGTGTTVTTSPQPLTLDQIAQRKLDGEGWGVIFKDLKSQNLVTTKNLGQAVSAYRHSLHHTQGTNSTTTASGRPFDNGSGSSTHGKAAWKDDDGSGGPGNSGSSSSSTSFSSTRGNAGGNSAVHGGGGGGGNAFGRSK